MTTTQTHQVAIDLDAWHARIERQQVIEPGDVDSLFDQLQAERERQHRVEHQRDAAEQLVDELRVDYARIMRQRDALALQVEAQEKSYADLEREYGRRAAELFDLGQQYDVLRRAIEAVSTDAASAAVERARTISQARPGAALVAERDSFRADRDLALEETKRLRQLIQRTIQALRGHDPIYSAAELARFLEQEVERADGSSNDATAR